MISDTELNGFILIRKNPSEVMKENVRSVINIAMQTIPILAGENYQVFNLHVVDMGMNDPLSCWIMGNVSMVPMPNNMSTN